MRIFVAGAAIGALAAGGAVLAQSLYKYQGDNGEWIYSDRPPPHGDVAEIRELPVGMSDPQVTVTHELVEQQIRLRARNDFLAPVEVILALDELINVGLPPPEHPLRWVLEPRSRAEILRLDAIDAVGAPSVEYRYVWLPGDPDSEHRPERPYRAPFGIAGEYTISQAFPVTMTHTTVDSRYAVDISMPIGTDIHAARGGTVVEVASTNFRGGFDTTRQGASANMIRILHDDGTFGIYAHLNWNSIRVQPGDLVERGEYIADSGNTGFSTGPHLHFAVVLNRGMRIESVPVEFEAQNGAAITPETGAMLTAY